MKESNKPNMHCNMPIQYHILNGDSLKEQFPEGLEGEIIITRECLVDGDVSGSHLDELFRTRAQFISNNYDGYSEEDYYNQTVSEFKKIAAIPADADINLWFEDDLFCQVNLWFTLSLLKQHHKNNPIFLIRPQEHNLYGFGALNTSELLTVYKNRSLLTDADQLAKLWTYYQHGQRDHLLNTAEALEAKYPFILAAVKAHLERMPIGGGLGRPQQTLIQILKELETEEFGPVFKEFGQRESIYGFGDLQVKRMLDEIINKR